MDLRLEGKGMLGVVVSRGERSIALQGGVDHGCRPNKGTCRLLVQLVWVIGAGGFL